MKGTILFMQPEKDERLGDNRGETVSISKVYSIKVEETRGGYQRNVIKEKTHRKVRGKRRVRSGAGPLNRKLYMGLGWGERLVGET